MGELLRSKACWVRRGPVVPASLTARPLASDPCSSSLGPTLNRPPRDPTEMLLEPALQDVAGLVTHDN